MSCCSVGVGYKVFEEFVVVIVLCAPLPLCGQAEAGHLPALPLPALLQPCSSGETWQIHETMTIGGCTREALCHASELGCQSSGRLVLRMHHSAGQGPGLSSLPVPPRGVPSPVPRQRQVPCAPRPGACLARLSQGSVVTQFWIHAGVAACAPVRARCVGRHPCRRTHAWRRRCLCCCYWRTGARTNSERLVSGRDPVGFGSAESCCSLSRRQPRLELL